MTPDPQFVQAMPDADLEDVCRVMADSADRLKASYDEAKELHDVFRNEIARRRP